MDVILLQKVANLGNIGDRVKVRSGYGRNFLLPQGKAEKDRRALNLVKQMDAEGFGNCTVTGSCEAVCPKEISLNFISKLNRDYGIATIKGK